MSINKDIFYTEHQSTWQVFYCCVDCEEVFTQHTSNLISCCLTCGQTDEEFHFRYSKRVGRMIILNDIELKSINETLTIEWLDNFKKGAENGILV